MKASGQSSEIGVKCCVLMYQRPWKWTNHVDILSKCPRAHKGQKCPLWKSQKSSNWYLIASASPSKDCQFLGLSIGVLSFLRSVIYLSSFPHAGGWLWEQGQQMFRKSSRGDAGIHADHHVMMSSSTSCHWSLLLKLVHALQHGSSARLLMMNPVVFLFQFNFWLKFKRKK